MRFLRRCFDDTLAGVSQELSELERRELEGQLWRDLEHFVRDEAEAELPLVPRRFEVSFGTERSSPELQRGLDLGGFALSGKIDRIDVDPMSARGIVWDYKSGKTAFSAAKIDSPIHASGPGGTSATRSTSSACQRASTSRTVLVMNASVAA